MVVPIIGEPITPDATNQDCGSQRRGGVNYTRKSGGGLANPEVAQISKLSNSVGDGVMFIASEPVVGASSAIREFLRLQAFDLP